MATDWSPFYSWSVPDCYTLIVLQQLHILVGRCAIALQRDARSHTGCREVEIETHFNGVHPIGRGSVVFAMDGDGWFLGHERGGQEGVRWSGFNSVGLGMAVGLN